MNVAGGLCLGQSFMRPRGEKGKGTGLVFVFSLLQSCRWAKVLRSGVQPQWVDAFGSRPGQQCKARVWMAVPGNPPCTACWQSIRVRSAQETRNCCMAPTAPEAAGRVLGTKEMLNPDPAAS
ncbi:hypothetical protein B0I37DRAFT_29005 [Chaetomium sp. MPI-CAGE-AT-0009]|nr:hypothetical protein B0I37DRAFT_29005 [Chaetomium sp. MPI-CAGE-AT-0009]